MAVVRTAYRALARHIKYFEAQRIPLTGVVSLPAVSADLATLSPLVSLQQAFRSPRYTLDDAFRAIQQLQAQLGVLSAGEETISALQIWHVVLTAQTASGHAESGAAASLERGSAALDAVLARYGCHPLDQDAGLDALASDYVEEEDSGGGRSPAEQVDHWSSEMTQRLSPVVASIQASLDSVVHLSDSSKSGSAATSHLVGAINRRLFGKDRFLRPEPFEWVYDGITPALPSALLANGGRADPLALAIIYSIVAAKQGLNLTPLPAIFTPLADVPSELPPRLAVRHALLGAAAAPDLPPWILRVEGGEEPAFIDVMKKGQLLSSAECAARYPGTDQHEVWTDRSALRLWASHVRTMVAAFQRRGESDAVAHSLYQLMSLDTETPEWERALAAPEMQRL